MLIRQILLIDDEPEIREIAKISLEIKPGLKVTLAASSQEGILRAEQEQPDVILLDMMMPLIDGITTFKRLQASPRTRHIPVIFLTANQELNEVQKLLSLGAKDLITKPFDPLHLANQLIKIMDWQAETQSNTLIH